MRMFNKASPRPASRDAFPGVPERRFPEFQMSLLGRRGFSYPEYRDVFGCRATGSFKVAYKTCISLRRDLCA